MEILKNHTGSVKFVIPDDQPTATFKVYKNDVQIGGVGNAIITPGVAECPIPYAAVQDEGKIKVTLTFVYSTVSYSKDKTVDVVTPYLDLYEVKDILGITNNKEAAAAEAAVRFVINAHTGQSFGRVVETNSVSGNNTTVLPLPSRLLSLTTINDSTDISFFTIEGDGFYLKYHPLGVPPVKADYYGLHQHVGGDIHNPNNVTYGVFLNGVSYRIAGEWGYDGVPSAVREAAQLLLGVYADPDTEYRDRYLTSMTAADWRIQFNDGAFVQTGHARADQLLAEFIVRRGWVVL